ncbi:MAG: IS1634 family transposase, partial [Alphaproteobacteria bacterium]|nr:IS1634 family transposase [Alphaproteobacteria bacterium]
TIVAKAARSPSAVAKQTKGVTPDGMTVHSFRSLLADLATLTRNKVVTPLNPDYEITVHARPTPIQQKAFDLLGLHPERTQ